MAQILGFAVDEAWLVQLSPDTLQLSVQDKAIKRFQVRNMETWLEYSTPLHVCAVRGKGRCGDVHKLQMCLRSKKIVS